MNELICPHCGKPGISFMRKMCLGPAVPATCKACGKKVGVPYIAATLAIVPFIVAIIASYLVESFMVKAGLLIAGAIAMSIIHMRWVPLEPR
jgi:hypothetical protein